MKRNPSARPLAWGVLIAIGGVLCWRARAWAAMSALALLLAAFAVHHVFRHREAMLRTGVALLSPRYRVVAGPLPEGKTLLVLPNHPALVDPLLVLTAYRAVKLRPLVDASFFAAPLFARVLKTLDAVPVPDLRGRHTAADVECVRGLRAKVVDTLAAGDSVLLYPAGHIYTKNSSRIGNRQLAYTVCRDLPPGVTVVGLRTEGLWGSMWSRCGRDDSPSFAATLAEAAFLWPFAFFMRRRTVCIHAEDMTERVRRWSAEPRKLFNLRLDDWYNRTRHPELDWQ